MHKHKEHSTEGPYGCAGSVKYVETCACGATRTVCDCHQCNEQGTSTTAWGMPRCDCCGLRHPTDVSCPHGGGPHSSPTRRTDTMTPNEISKRLHQIRERRAMYLDATQCREETLAWLAIHSLDAERKKLEARRKTLDLT